MRTKRGASPSNAGSKQPADNTESSAEAGQSGDVSSSAALTATSAIMADYKRQAVEGLRRQSQSRGRRAQSPDAPAASPKGIGAFRGEAPMRIDSSPKARDGNSGDEIVFSNPIMRQDLDSSAGRARARVDQLPANPASAKGGGFLGGLFSRFFGGDKAASSSGSDYLVESSEPESQHASTLMGDGLSSPVISRAISQSGADSEFSVSNPIGQEGTSQRRSERHRREIGKQPTVGLAAAEEASSATIIDSSKAIQSLSAGHREGGSASAFNSSAKTALQKVRRKKSESVTAEGQSSDGSPAVELEEVSPEVSEEGSALTTEASEQVGAESPLAAAISGQESADIDSKPAEEPLTGSTAASDQAGAVLPQSSSATSPTEKVTTPATTSSSAPPTAALDPSDPKDAEAEAKKKPPVQTASGNQGGGASADSGDLKKTLIVSAKGAIALALALAVPGLGFVLAAGFLYFTKNIGNDQNNGNSRGGDDSSASVEAIAQATQKAYVDGLRGRAAETHVGVAAASAADSMIEGLSRPGLGAAAESLAAARGGDSPSGPAVAGADLDSPAVAPVVQAQNTSAPEPVASPPQPEAPIANNPVTEARPLQLDVASEAVQPQSVSTTAVVSDAPATLPTVGSQVASLAEAGAESSAIIPAPSSTDAVQPVVVNSSPVSSDQVSAPVPVPEASSSALPAPSEVVSQSDETSGSVESSSAGDSSNRAVALEEARAVADTLRGRGVEGDEVGAGGRAAAPATPAQSQKGQEEREI